MRSRLARGFFSGGSREMVFAGLEEVRQGQCMYAPGWVGGSSKIGFKVLATVTYARRRSEN